MKGDCASRARRRAISVFPTPGRADHQNVLRRDLVSKIVRDTPKPAPSVPQRDGDSTLCVGMTDYETVKLGDDLTGGKFGHAP